MTDVQGKVDRLEAWVDGGAICVIAVSAFGILSISAKMRLRSSSID
jgi:hypothetical protein